MSSSKPVSTSSSDVSLGQKQNEKLAILTRFKSTIIELLDDLIDQFPHEKNLVFARIFIDKPVPIEDLVKAFTAAILPVQQMVADRDEAFFLQQNSSRLLFGGLEDSDVNNLKAL